MKLAVDLADAIVTELSGGTFTEPVSVVRRVLPEFELAELGNLTVAVVPKSVEITNVTRQSSQYDVAVDIGIQQKIGKQTDDEVLRLSGIVSQVVAFLNRRSFAALQARFKTIANEPVYAPELLSEKRLFLSVITVTYTMME